MSYYGSGFEDPVVQVVGYFRNVEGLEIQDEGFRVQSLGFKLSPFNDMQNAAGNFR